MNLGFSIMIKLLKILITIIVSFLSILLLSEIYLRHIGLGNPLIYKTSLRYGYLPLENQKIVRFNGSNITINNKNFRTANNIDFDKKIFFLGDSVTYGGSYIDDKNLFSNKVCKNISKLNNLNYSCYNGGVNAYGFENIIKRLQFLEYNKNDFVVVTFILGNFYRNFAQIESLPYFTKKNESIFKANFELLGFLIDKFRNFLRFKNKEFSDFKNQNELNYLKSKIDKDIKILREYTHKNKNIIVLFSPSQNYFQKKNSFIMEEYLFKNYTDNLNFFSISDLIDEGIIEKIYYDNVHLNKYGHKVYSDIITNILLSKIINE